MIRSKYIHNILTMLLDGDSEGVAVRPQLNFLSDIEYKYTGSGLFVTFAFDDAIFQYKYATDTLVLTGLKITTTEYPIEAEANLFLKNGIINYLEIWCYNGDYPHKDLTTYTLTQLWNGSPGKQITIGT